MDGMSLGFVESFRGNEVRDSSRYDQVDKAVISEALLKMGCRRSTRREHDFQNEDMRRMEERERERGMLMIYTSLAQCSHFHSSGEGD